MNRNTDLFMRPLVPGLISLSLIGWGLLRGVWWLGALLALLVELPRFIKARKHFRAPDYSRAFTLSWLIMAMVAAIIWLQDASDTSYKPLVEFLPVFFLPVILCQLFAEKSHLPMHTISLLSTWRHNREVKAGEPEDEEWRMNFAFLYVFIILLAASWNLKTLNLKAGYAALASIILWRFLFFIDHPSDGKKRWRGQLIYIGAIVFSCFIGLGAIKLYRYLESGQWINHRQTDTPSQNGSRLGQIGEIKLDPKIHWRIIAPELAPPPLLRDRVFNHYINETWHHKPTTGLPKIQDYQDFGLVPFQDETAYFVDINMPTKTVEKETYSKLRIRGKGYQKTLLPNTNAILALKTKSVEGLEYNSLGSVLATNPLTGVIDYISYNRIDHQKDLIEEPPNPEVDLTVPEQLQKPLTKFLANNHIPEETDLKSAQRLLQYIFREDFTYSLQNNIQGIFPIRTFLLHTKSGHCEYFASAGVMLLRQLGIPARYTLGYTVTEFDTKRNEWALRGLNYHAWVRAWDAESGRWVDVDFTPPSHLNDIEKPSVLQNFQDNLKRWRENFLVWREENGDHWVFTILPWFLTVILILIFGRNLLKARSGKNTESSIDRIMLPLAKKLKIPARRPAQSYENWLASTPLPQPEKDKLSLITEEFIYGQNEDLKGLKALVKEIKALQL